MKTLFRKQVESIVRKAMVAAAAYLVAHAWLAPGQGNVLLSDPVIDVLVSLALGAIAVGWGLVQARFQEQVTRTAAKLPADTPVEDVVSLVKRAVVKIPLFDKVLPIVLLALLVPSIAGAQSIRSSAIAAAHDLALQQTPAAAPVTVAAVVQNPRIWLRVAEASYVSAMLFDTWNACSAMRANGTVPSNAAVPDSCNKLIATKVPVAIGTLVAAEKLWPDDSCTSGCTLRQLEAIGSLVGSALFTLATPQQDPVPGAPTATLAKRFALAFSIRR